MPDKDTSLTITYDTVSDVLYVKITNHQITHSSTLDDDNFVIFNYNESGEIVGLQLIDFSDVTPNYWRGFEKEVPPMLYDAVTKWIGSE